MTTLAPLVQMVPLALTALADDDAVASLAVDVLTRMLTSGALARTDGGTGTYRWWC